MLTLVCMKAHNFLVCISNSRCVETVCQKKVIRCSVAIFNNLHCKLDDQDKHDLTVMFKNVLYFLNSEMV